MSKKRHQLAIHSVFRSRENLFFIKEWIYYHTCLGVEHFYLYDNSESIGGDGSTPVVSKYGFDFKSMTKGLSNKEVRTVLEAILTEFGDRCTLIDWKPRDDQGRVVFDLGNSFRHCVTSCISDTEWLCAIDMDEYLFSPSEYELPSLLKDLQEERHSRACILQKKFSDRFLHMEKHVIDIEECIEGIDTSGWAPKYIINTEAYDPDMKFNIHRPSVMTGSTHYYDPEVLRFNHYNINDWQLNWMKSFYKSNENFKINAVDTGMQRYREAVHYACETFGSPAWRNAIMELEA